MAIGRAAARASSPRARQLVERRPDAGGDRRRPGGGRSSSSSTSRARRSARPDRVGLPDAGARPGFDGRGMEGFFAAHAGGHADLRGHRAGLPAHAPDDRRAHLRHAEPHAQPAVQAARRQPRVPVDPGAPARAAGDHDAGLARRSWSTSTARSTTARPTPSTRRATGPRSRR
ncbi:MAG: hypothetical protein MZW92_01865 [Comamonadaceae bacterium]|nr:hypothetical protein [Comamonadaceae bacterium]